MEKSKSVVLIVTHPDDETLWAGGTILSHPEWKCFIISLCRGHDPDRVPKFYKALKFLKAEGIMGDLDDGPEQKPLDLNNIQNLILNLMPSGKFDRIITHSPNGEYTRHLRHEETGKSVLTLWEKGKLIADELWTFAYNDNNKQNYPNPVENADVYQTFSKKIWLKKFRIITEIYGFAPDSWEAKTTPSKEAFSIYPRTYNLFRNTWLFNNLKK